MIASKIEIDYDELNIKNDATLKKRLAIDEKILLSTTVYKYNKRNKRQNRLLLITNKAIYNIAKQNIIMSLMSASSSTIKRRIDITKVSGLTISELSSEFVIHVTGEYDYRYASTERREQILIMILKAYYTNVYAQQMPVFFKSDINLTQYTTTEDDKKKNMIRIPKDKPRFMLEEDLQEYFDDSRKKQENMNALTEPIYSKPNGLYKAKLDDFELIKVLGRGAFGKVMLVEKKGTKQIYALKSMRKEEIIEKDQINHTKTERYVLEKSKSPFLVSLEYAFQTPEKIFFVMNFMRGGELFQHLRITKRFEEERAKFYATEIILALEHLHKMNVVYRDLKPENILMDDDGHVCLTDFGMAKILAEGDLTNSFVGTPEYLAPEIIESKGHSKLVDWWSLGILIYEMIFGIPPFYNKEQNQSLMFKWIREKDVTFPSKFTISDDGKDIILQLLKKRPESRLGAGGADEVKNHRWFKDINWRNVEEKKVKPPFKPKITGEYDVDNFDTEFTAEDPIYSLVPDTNMRLIKKHQSEFDGMTFVPSNLPERMEQTL